VENHRWFGIGTAILSTLLWISYSWAQGSNDLLRKYLPWLTAGVLTWTGHLGGSLTHGADYLLKSAPTLMQQWMKFEAEDIRKNRITDVQQAFAYNDLASVIIREKCVGCHGPDKQKGGLRLDNPDWILKGGKNGKVLEAGNADQSELIKRLLLPMNDDDHMPPPEKPQLSAAELGMLHWWVREGASFEKKIVEIPQTDTIRTFLKRFVAVGQESIVAKTEPIDEPQRKASADTLAAIQKLGIQVLPISAGSGNLTASFLNATGNPDSLLALLTVLSPQLISLDLAEKPLTDKGAQKLSAFTRLYKLNLRSTNITNEALAALQPMRKLRYLNLTNTRVDMQGIGKMGKMPQVEDLYLAGTGIRAENWQAVREQFPEAIPDSGGYRLPLLIQDTQKVKAGKKR
jgi:mono/diheme cytochrome c family protein